MQVCCEITDLERASSWCKQLKTGGFFAVFSQIGHCLHAVFADIKGALLLFICREESKHGRRHLTQFINLDRLLTFHTNLSQSQSSRISDCSEHTISSATLSRRSCDLETKVHQMHQISNLMGFVVAIIHLTLQITSSQLPLIRLLDPGPVFRRCFTFSFLLQVALLQDVNDIRSCHRGDVAKVCGQKR